MERYNITFRRPPQVLPLAEASADPLTAASADPLTAASAEMTPFARWPAGVSKSHPSAISAGVAMLLHVAVGAVLLTVVQPPAAPEFADEQVLALVFAPPQSEPHDVPAPPAMPEPPPAAEIPAPPETPAAQPSPPEPLPPPPAETKLSEAPPPIAHPPVARKTTKRVAPPHTAESQTAIQPHPSDLPATQPASRSSAAEAPIAADWQRSLATWLATHRSYPDEARRRGMEGKVALRLTVDRSGRVRDVVLVHSAGSSTLDTAAEAMLRNAVLPPFSAGMSQDTVTFTVQLHYALTD